MGKLSYHLLYINDEELKQLIPNLQERIQYRKWMLGYVRSNHEISNQIIVVQIYFHQALRKIKHFISKIDFVQRLQEKECSFCDPENSHYIKEHQFLGLIQIIRKLIINLFEVDIVLSDECIDFLEATEHLAHKILKRKCVKRNLKQFVFNMRNLTFSELYLNV